MHYDLTTLPNGLRVISEKMPGVRSVAVGCWIDSGTRDERPNEAGASHFLEHLLFKGTDEISAREISETFDSMGAQSNAFTSKEFTCFWGRMIDEDLPTGLGLLSEMLQRPAFREVEIDSERHVVVEEINMNEDDPNDVVFEAFSQRVFAGHPLERPVLGTRESILGMTRDDIHGYWDRRYGVHSTVIAIAGSIEHETAVGMAEELFGEWDGETVDHEHQAIDLTPSAVAVTRETEQAHLLLGGLGLSRDDDRRWAYEVMNHILGGGMSSRLFRSIREERGLAYSVYSFAMPAAETGAWGVYVGTTPNNTDTVIELVQDELERMVTDGVDDTELERARGNVRGSLALSIEDANSRMIRLGRQEISHGEHLSVGERIEKIQKVTAADVLQVAKSVLTGPKVIAAVGPFESGDLEHYVS